MSPGPPHPLHADIDAADLYARLTFDSDLQYISGTSAQIPRDVFKHIIDLLGEDILTLYACSRTCRALYQISSAQLERGRSDHFQTPRFYSGTTAQIPRDVFKHIIDLLEEDILTLYAFSRTCRALHWMSYAHLERGRSDHIQTQRMLDFLSRLLRSDRTRRYWQSPRITLSEGDTRPFCHTLPTRIPGHLCPGLKDVTIRGAHWERLPPVLFNYFAGYRSVTSMTLHRCSFNGVNDLYSIVHGLKNLQKLALEAITFRRPYLLPARPAASAFRETQLQEVDLSQVDGRHLAPLGSMFLSYSSVKVLSLRDIAYQSFQQFQTLVEQLASLEGLKLSGASFARPHLAADSATELSVDSVSIASNSSSALVLHEVDLRGLSQIDTKEVLAWLAEVAPRCFPSESLQVREDALSPLVGYRFLERVGTTVQRLSITIVTDSILTSLPPLMYCTKLKTLSLRIFFKAYAVPKAVENIRALLVRLLSHEMTSTNLEVFDFTFLVTLEPSSTIICDDDLSNLVDEADLQTFADILARDVYNGLRPRSRGESVILISSTLDFSSTPDFSTGVGLREALARSSAAAIAPLFDPWFRRGVLALWCFSNHYFNEISWAEGTDRPAYADFPGEWVDVM